MKKTIIYLLVIVMVCMISVPVFAASAKANVGINVLLNTEVNDDVLKELGKHGKVLDVLYEIDALTMRVKANELESIKALPFVEAANPDAERKGSPIDTVPGDSMNPGFSTWNMDAVNIMDSFYLPNPDVDDNPETDDELLKIDYRAVSYDGTGVYIAVLDTGLLDTWRQYFPEERIAVEYAKSFGGGPVGNVSEQPNKWEHDTNSHGTHVTSTILGYSFYGNPINGVAPNATIIPVKVLNQNGSGWSSVIARGIEYVGELKEGPLKDYPVVINMSLGGSALDAVEQAAIDYALSVGVIIVASAGNEGESGMGYPGAYEPVISVAASGWVNEWEEDGGWMGDVADPINPDDFYIVDFSSRQHDGQDLDVVAPGSWIVGPYQINRGQISYYYLGGTSMASPHVAGVVALMAEKDPSLSYGTAESILQDSAVPIPAGLRTVLSPYGYETFTWEDDATGSGLVDAQGALGMLP